MSDKSNKVVVRSFSGAKIGDLFHYVVPALETKPEKLILHIGLIGTNNVRNEDPQEVAETIVELCEFIEEKSPDTQIGLSELTPRSDSKEANNSSE